MNAPLFSIVTPVYNPDVTLLKQTIHSVLSQTFDNWEWILVDDASPNPEVLQTLQTFAKRESRLKVIERVSNGHIVKASNDGLAAARGAWIVLLDHDDILAPSALRELYEAIQDHPNAGYLYSDEDKITVTGRQFDVFRKPDWSPERLRHQMYLGHLSALRTDLVRRVGGFHDGFDGSQDHDLALRVTELCDEVVHVPSILYHWRASDGSAALNASAKPYATSAGIKAVNAHFDRIGLSGSTTAVQHPTLQHTYVSRRGMPTDSVISVIVPTRGSSSLVWGVRRCLVVETVRSLLDHTNRNIELVVVHDLETPQSALKELQELAGDQIKFVNYGAPFNFSEKCNLGFCNSSGDYIVLLNDDLEIISDDFLEQLCAPLIESTVGITGARLLYPDTTIQHAGVSVCRGEFRHSYLGEPDSSPGNMGELMIDREVTAVTGAALAVRRDDFIAVGGLCEELPVNFNDVDFCLKVRSLGKRIIALSQVKAFHFESQTRTPLVRQFEIDFMDRRWGRPDYDPYFTANNTI